MFSLTSERLEKLEGLPCWQDFLHSPYPKTFMLAFSRAALLSASTYLYIGPDTHTIIIYAQELVYFFLLKKCNCIYSDDATNLEQHSDFTCFMKNCDYLIENFESYIFFSPPKFVNSA